MLPSSDRIISHCGLKNRQPDQEADDQKQEIKRLKFDENKEIEQRDKDKIYELSENQESSEGKCVPEEINTMSEDCGECKQSLLSVFNVAAESKCSIMYISIGSTQAGPSEDKETCEIHLHSVEREGIVVQQEHPASPVTSSSFEHQIVESSCSNMHDAACDVLVPLTSSSTDSSTEGDNSNSTKTAEEPVDKI